VINVHRSRIAGERGKQNIIHVGHGSPDFVNECLPDGKLLEIQSGHSALLSRHRIERARPSGINIAADMEFAICYHARQLAWFQFTGILYCIKGRVSVGSNS
jgi:hypothetical protein